MMARNYFAPHHKNLILEDTGQSQNNIAFLLRCRIISSNTARSVLLQSYQVHLFAHTVVTSVRPFLFVLFFFNALCFVPEQAWSAPLCAVVKIQP